MSALDWKFSSRCCCWWSPLCLDCYSVLLRYQMRWLHLTISSLLSVGTDHGRSETPPYQALEGVKLIKIVDCSDISSKFFDIKFLILENAIPYRCKKPRWKVTDFLVVTNIFSRPIIFISYFLSWIKFCCCLNFRTQNKRRLKKWQTLFILLC